MAFCTGPGRSSSPREFGCRYGTSTPRAGAAAQRVQTSMLVWRKGIVLLHDIHPEAAKVTARLEANRNNDVGGLDCHDYR